MAIYVFTCQNPECGKEFEKVTQQIQDPWAMVVKCPICGSEVKPKMTAHSIFTMKGGMA